MLIPIGQEDTSVRRLPWVTFGIMITCLLVFVLTLPATKECEREARQKLGRAAVYWLQHPYLERDPRLARAMSQGRQDVDEALTEVTRQFGEKPPRDASVLKDQQAQLQSYVDQAYAAVDRLPGRRLGLVPAHIKAYALITHMFMHGGWLHLIGNMFILFLTGPFLEDAWGRPLYGGFYLMAGVFAALMYTARYPHWDGYVIGASGAIAGVMGAFLIRFWNRKIRFFYWIGFVFHGTFSAPAWLMLGLWLAREILFAQAMDVVAPGSGGGGVARWAHVWGFAFGAVVAIGMRKFDIEKRYIHPAIESKITLVDNTAIEDAMDVFRSGDSARALELLRGEVTRNRDNMDAALAYWNVACQAGAAAEAAPIAVQLIRQSLRSNDTDLGLAIWTELSQRAPERPLDPATAVAVAEALMASGREDDAGQALAPVATAEPEKVPPGPLVRAARLAVELGVPAAAALVEGAGSNPDVPSDTLEELRQELSRRSRATGASTGGDGAGGGGEEEDEQQTIEVAAAVRHTLKIMEAVPVRLEAEGLVLKVGGGERLLRHEQVLALATVGIRGDGQQRPFVVVDLLLDSPWSESVALRVVRVNSTSFDPRPIVNAEGSPVDGLRQLLGVLLKATGAVPLPDPEAVRGHPFAMFDSLKEYESQVLGVG